jgi:beta-mannosidase
MPPRVLSLNGDWQLTGTDPDGRRPPHRLTAAVPGQVHADLLRAGLLPDPFHRDQAAECQWVERWPWRYVRQFCVPPGWLTGWDVLQFDGLDTFAEVRLNGVVLGSAANMFTPHWFDVSGAVREGMNRLEVVLTPPAEAVAGRDTGVRFGCFASDRLYMRRMQCSHGWDWVHRFVSMGIWRPVRLASYDRVRLDDVAVRVTHLDDDVAALDVQVALEDRTAAPVPVRVDIVAPGGEVVYRKVLEAEGGAARIHAEVPQPLRWWPNGHGDQPLYQCRVSALPGEGPPLDSRTVRFGIRTVAVEQLPDAARRDGFDAPGSTWTLIVNGRRIFCKGANWVPPDPWPARIAPSRYERLVSLARDGGMNMLRAWGGGVYEPEAFWEACDRLGIMVWQDFMLACGEYPEEDEAFLHQLRREFEHAVRSLRNHPSLVLWCGDNELGMNDAPGSGHWGQAIAERVSGPVCAELDPARPFVPTSPHRGTINNAPEAGDCHRSAWYDPEFLLGAMEDYPERIDASWGRFVSEYAIAGAPPLRSLLKFMAPDDLVDPAARIWELRSGDNPYNGVDALTHFRMLERTARLLYGDTNDPQSQVRYMEYVQYEFVARAIAAHRRRMFDCSGLLFWMFNDCWPASGFSLVDYYGVPKAGYYAARAAFAPVIVALEPLPDRVRVWLCNDTADPVETKLILQMQPWAGEPAWSREMLFNVPANSAHPVTDVPRGDLAPQAMLVADAVYGTHRRRALHYPGMPRDMDMPSTLLQVAHAGGGAEGAVTVSTEHYARVVTLEADLDFSDNYFDLLPGEQRTVTWRNPSPGPPPPVNVVAWNGSPVP